MAEEGQKAYEIWRKCWGFDEEFAETEEGYRKAFATVERTIANEALRRAAEVAIAAAERHREGAANCAAEGLRDAAGLASYSARCIGDVVEELRALIKEPGHEK